MLIRVECEACRSSFHLDEGLIGGARGARVRCRKCGASIDVVRPGTAGDEADPAANAAESPAESTAESTAESSVENAAENTVENAAVNPDGREKAMAEETGGQQAVAAEKKDDRGWISPAYTVSRSVQLDPARVLANRCVAYLPDGPGIEPYRVLRTRILQRVGEGKGTLVMITSALPGEGKTLTAINLALTFSRSYGQTALLVDADLRQQRVHQVLGYESEVGLADYLLNGCAMPDLFVWPGIEKFTVISGGKTVGESSELIGSSGMKRVIAEMRDRYPERYVFIDAPPVLAGADALALAPLVDHVVMVVQAEKTSLVDVRKAIELLPADRFLGFVLNRNSHDGGPGYYPRSS